MIYPKFPTKYIAFSQYFHSEHKAVDIANAVTVGSKKYDNSAQVCMAHKGKIVQNGYASDYGYYVEYEVKDGKDTWLFASGHFPTKSKLVIGKTYEQGTFISKMGSTGTSQGVHDHFRVTKNGVRVDPLKYVYVYPDQVVGTLETAKLLYYTPITPAVKRDETKDQLKTNTTLNVRAGAGTNQKVLGQVNAGNMYNFYETKVSGGYTWYRIATGQWLAQDSKGTYLTIYKKKEEEDPEMIKKLEEQVKSLESEIKALNTKVSELEKDIATKDQTIIAQKKTINDLETEINELKSRTWFTMFIDWLRTLFKKS